MHLKIIAMSEPYTVSLNMPEEYIKWSEKTVGQAVNFFTVVKGIPLDE